MEGLLTWTAQRVAKFPRNSEFTVQEIVARSAQVGGKAFSPSHVNQMLAALAGNGLLYKNRHGKYCFAVPMFEKFIVRLSGGAGKATPTQ